MRGRRAVDDGGAAHPAAAAVAMFFTAVLLGVTFGVLVADWGWSWLTTILGMTTVAGSLVVFVCLLPDYSGSELDGVEERALYEDYPATAPTLARGIPGVTAPDWRPGKFGYASEQEFDDVERAVSERERGDRS